MLAGFSGCVSPRRRTPTLDGLIMSGSAEYEKLVLGHSARYQAIRPAGILLAREATAIETTLRYCRDNFLALHTRSGGHCFEDFNTGPGILLDLQRLKKMQILKEGSKHYLTVDAGARTGAITAYLEKKGFVLPMGSCSSVGIAGLTLGGGYGLLSRRYGLTSDSLVALKLIAADGKVYAASQDENPDLFWACRGGGGGQFGIVTEFKFEIYPAAPVTGIQARFAPAQAREAFELWQNAAPSAPRELTSVFILLRGKTGTVSGLLLGEFTGKTSGARTALKPLLELADPARLEIGELSHATMSARFGGPLLGEPTSVLFKSKSDYFYKPLSTKEVALIFNVLEAPRKFSQMMIFDAYAGAISDVDVKDSAFAHRKARLLAQYRTDWSTLEDSQAAIAELNEIYNAVHSFASGRAYANYCDRDLKNWGEAYYGENLSRLIQIKKKWDPNSFFQHGQNLATLI